MPLDRPLVARSHRDIDAIRSRRPMSRVGTCPTLRREQERRPGRAGIPGANHVARYTYPYFVRRTRSYGPERVGTTDESENLVGEYATID
jgi:hypothetical protein